MKPEPLPTTDHRPAGSQFSLRGMFALLTATSVIFAILALVIRSPLHWLGALAVPVICLGIIATMELGRRWFPPPPRWAPRDVRAEYLLGPTGGNPFGPTAPRSQALPGTELELPAAPGTEERSS